MLTLCSLHCAREEAPGHAHEEAHQPDDHGHEHDASSLGTITMMPDVLAANGVVIKRSAPGLVSTEIDLPGEIVLNADRVAHVVPRFPGIVQRVNKSLGDAV